MITLTPYEQKILKYAAEKELKKATENLAFVQNRYDHWDEITDSRILNRYTREQYKENYIEHWKLEIERLTSRIERINAGYDFE